MDDESTKDQFELSTTENFVGLGEAVTQPNNQSCFYRKLD